jgi:hypothetical protein
VKIVQRRLKLLLGHFLLGLCSAAAAADLPQAFEAHYSLYRAGAKVAEMLRVFTRLDDGIYRYRSETRTTGLFSVFRKDHVIEQSNWRLQDGELRPLQYLYEHSGGKKDRNVAVTFDWEAQRITNTVNGHSWRMPAEPKVMDKLLYQLAIMHDLKAGRSDLAYTIADGGKIKTYNFELLGEETISTPLGKLDTIKVSRLRVNSKRETVFWCAEKLHFLPVRVENIETDGGKTTVLIDSIAGLSPAQ